MPSASKRDRRAQQSSSSSAAPSATPSYADDKKDRLPTSQQVYHRLRTDSVHFQPHLCRLSYSDNRRGEIEIPIEQFQPISEGGDVPWHRITNFKYRDQVVWERASKFCSLDDIALQEAAAAAAIIPLKQRFRALTYNIMDEPGRTRLTHTIRQERSEALQHVTNPQANPSEDTKSSIASAEEGSRNEDSSKPAEGLELLHADANTVVNDSSSSNPPRIGAVATLENVLAAEAHRFQCIIDLLLSTKADLICLQEVNDSFLEFLDASPSVKSTWPHRACTALPRQNVCLLSNCTIRSSQILQVPGDLSKQFVAAELMDPVLGERVCVIGVHLTSSRATHATSKRATQLAMLSSYLSSARCAFGAMSALILGDFNAQEITLPNMQDCITESYASYDPIHNPHASSTTVSGIPQAMDKILVREYNSASGASARGVPASLAIHPTGQWELVKEIEKKASEKINPSTPYALVEALESSSSSTTDSTTSTSTSFIPPSDHYPLLVELEFVQLRNEVHQAVQSEDQELDHNCALVLLPLPLQMMQIDAARRILADPRVDRWMAHCTLAHPFLPLEQLQPFLDDVLHRPLLSQPQGFEAVFDHVDHFEHAKSETYFLAPQREASSATPIDPSSSSSIATVVAPSGTVPSTLENLRALYAELQRRWPAVFDRKGEDFNPHITLGKKAPVESLIHSLLTGENCAIRFPVSNMYVIRKDSNKKDARYQITHVLPLTGGIQACTPASMQPSLTPNNIHSLISQVLAALSLQNEVPHVQWIVGGSRAFDHLAVREGIVKKNNDEVAMSSRGLQWQRGSGSSDSDEDTSESDIDLIAVLPPGCRVSAGVFLSQLARHASSLGPMQHPRVLAGRHEVYLKLQWMHCVDIDVHVVAADQLELPAQASSTLTSSDAPSAKDSAQVLNWNTSVEDVLALSRKAPVNFSPAREPYMIWSLLRTALNRRRFLRVRQVVCAAAKKAQVYGAATGYLPGLAWSILAAHMVLSWESDSSSSDSATSRNQEEGDISERSILQRFAQVYGSAEAFSKAITLHSASTTKKESEVTELVSAAAEVIEKHSVSSTVTRTAPAASVVRSVGHSDRLMQILTCSDLIPRNIVRTLTPATRDVLIQEFANQFDGRTLKQPFGLTIRISVEFAHASQLVDCHGWLKEKLPSFVAQLSKQVEDVRPFALTEPSAIPVEGESGSFRLGCNWAVGHASNTSAVHRLCSNLLQSMRPLFPYLQLDLETNTAV